jgi:hypothetical protein
MTTEQAQEATPEVQATEGTQTVPEQPNTTGQGTDTTWTLDAALAEIKKLRAEAAGYRREKTAAEKARETAEQAALTEQGKFKELFEKAQPKIADYDSLKERYDAMVAHIQEMNDRRIAAIPDSMKSLVPDYDDPQRLAAWLEANAATLTKPVAPSLDGGAGGNRGVAPVTEEEVAAFAQRMGVDPRHVDRAALAKMKPR